MVYGTLMVIVEVMVTIFINPMFIVVYGDMSLVFWWFSVKFHGD